MVKYDSSDPSGYKMSDLVTDKNSMIIVMFRTGITLNPFLKSIHGDIIPSMLTNKTLACNIPTAGNTQINDMDPNWSKT